MAILKVLNVGQGDSLILTPPEECCYHGTSILVDLGPGQYDITEHIGKKERVCIVITHHDEDHLKGMQFFVDKMNQVERIFVPFYQNEITMIAKGILSLKGMYLAKDCGEFIRLLEDIIANQMYLKKLSDRSQGGPKLAFLYEGSRLCDHITCLNPPVMADTFNWLKETSAKELSRIMDDLFDSTFAECLDVYIRVRKNGDRIVDSSQILNIMLNDEIELDDEQRRVRGRDIYTIKGSYVVNFFLQNLENFRAFNLKPERETLRVIYKDFVKHTHDTCIVLKAIYRDKSFLLTGDASKKVFDRLIRNGVDISADYLKMPHHGSKHNITKNILDKIKPEVAIISHNNRRFGPATDSHPNIEILKLLDTKGIRIMLTNDVYKHGIKCMERSNHSGDYFVEIL